MNKENLTDESKKLIKDILNKSIAGVMKRIQADNVFNLENELNKLYSLFFTLKEETVNKEYILEKISQLIARKPFSLSYEPTLLAYCLNRGLIDSFPKDNNFLSICEKAIKEEKLINFEPFEKVNLKLENDKEC